MIKTALSAENSTAFKVASHKGGSGWPDHQPWQKQSPSALAGSGGPRLSFLIASLFYLRVKAKQVQPRFVPHGAEASLSQRIPERKGPPGPFGPSVAITCADCNPR